MTSSDDSIDYFARVVIPDSVLMQELDGEAVLLQLEAGKYFGLDQVGTRMLQLLADSPTVQQTYDRLLEEYDVDADRLRSDLERMIGELGEQGLIELRLEGGSHGEVER